MLQFPKPKNIGSLISILLVLIKKKGVVAVIYVLIFFPELSSILEPPGGHFLFGSQCCKQTTYARQCWINNTRRSSTLYVVNYKDN